MRTARSLPPIPFRRDWITRAWARSMPGCATAVGSAMWSWMTSRPWRPFAVSPWWRASCRRWSPPTPWPRPASWPRPWGSTSTSWSTCRAGGTRTSTPWPPSTASPWTEELAVSRIKACLDRLKSQGRSALVPYLVAGDPRPEATVDILHALVEGGADILELGVPFSDPMAEGPTIQLGPLVGQLNGWPLILELGVPFSDPMAEGPTIQLAHERALAYRVSLRSVLDMVARFRQRDEDTPIVLMGYANPVERMGARIFADAAAAAGVDGLLIVDMPPEEAGELNAELKRVGMDAIFLLAPTTTAERMGHVARLASGYLYYVSLRGVTGAAHLDVEEVDRKVAEIKALTDLPVAVGFGIKDGAAAAAIARVAEGVVVGSALVERMATAGEQGAASAGAALMTELRQAMDG